MFIKRGLKMEKFKLWEQDIENNVFISYYRPLQKTTDIAVVIFPGGAYLRHAAHEGEGYAQMLNTLGISAFVVNYRVYPNHFPAPLLDARRAIRFVRSKAVEFEINKDKVLAMGSSAGGHLTALLSTYLGDIGEDKNDILNKEDFLPNGQILCYPVVSSDESISHIDSYKFLLGNAYSEKDKYSPDLLVNTTTPPAFIWHAADDDCVSCVNSYRYAEALTRCGVLYEVHIFPKGGHGIGLAPHLPNVAKWSSLLDTWIKMNY